MTVPFLLDRVLYALDLLPSSRAVEVAEQALQEGFDSTATLHLASLLKSEARWADIQIIFESVLADTGARKLSRFEAQPLLLKHLVQQYCNGTISTRTLLDEVYRFSYESVNGAVDHPRLRRYLLDLDYLDSMYSDAAVTHNLSRMVSWEKKIAKVCRQVLEEVDVSGSEF